MTLKDYFSTYGIKKTFFALQIGVSRVYLSRIVSGKQQPSLGLAIKIKNATKGEVTLKDLIKDLDLT